MRAERTAQGLLVCQEHLKRFQEGDSFLLCVVAWDEFICYYHDRESRRENKQWKHTTSPPSKKSWSQPSAKKVIPYLSSSYHGCLLTEFLSPVPLSTLPDHHEKLRAKVSQSLRGSPVNFYKLLSLSGCKFTFYCNLYGCCVFLHGLCQLLYFNTCNTFWDGEVWSSNLY